MRTWDLGMTERLRTWRGLSRVLLLWHRGLVTRVGGGLNNFKVSGKMQLKPKVYSNKTKLQGQEALFKKEDEVIMM